ncbi:hypothetical protein [Streptomyces sp. NPDC055607]
MLTTESITTRFITQAQAQLIADQWNALYPTMRQILDAVIKARREAGRPAADIARLETVRRELGQLDRGTYKSCTRSPGAFSVRCALAHVHRVLTVASLGDPAKGPLYRLAADLADLNLKADTDAAAYFRTREEATASGPGVDPDGTDKAHSTVDERSLTR